MFDDSAEAQLALSGAGGGGGKGGGGGGSSPKEATDNLNSTAYASIIDLISEGEIEGFATPSKLGLVRDNADYNTAALKDVFFNNTAVLTKDIQTVADIKDVQKTDYAFKNVTFTPRYGTGTNVQKYIPGFSAVEEEVGVTTTVKKDLPVTRTVSGDGVAEVDAIRFTISVPSLQRFTDKGDIVGASIKLKIWIEYISTAGNQTSGFLLAKEDKITGRTADKYQRDYRIDLKKPTEIGFSWDNLNLRVQRITKDSSSTKLADEFEWTSFTLITDAKLSYPHSALIGLRVDAEQFSNIPSRAYRIRGIKVPIPRNATVDKSNGRLIYAGPWDGTFSEAQWCSDPCWCLYAMLIDTRYGFGDYIQAATLDKWSFYSASLYCNQLVPDLLGGYEPRFSLNCNIQSQQEAFKLIGDLCSVFRAMPYWANGSLTVSQDQPQDPVYLFSLANVTPEGFTYQGASLKTRHTVAICKYFDMNARDAGFEVVEDQEAIAKYGVNTLEVDSFGCTSRGQARRLGRWLLYTERREANTISFTTSIDAGIVCRPGQIISVSDPVRSNARRAGRIAAASTSEITVDNTDATDLTISSGGKLWVILSDGTVEWREVASVTDAVITVQTPFSSAPIPNSIWMLEDSQFEPTLWRVLSVQEQDNVQYAISAISYEPAKYAYVEQNIPIPARSIGNLTVKPATPGNLKATEVFYVVGNRVLTKFVVTWTPVKGITNYRVRYRDETSNWIEATSTAPTFDILEIVAQRTYAIEVYSISPSQISSSDPAQYTTTATGLSQEPGDVTGASITPVDETIGNLQWDLTTDLDVLIGGKTLIHHDPRTDVSASWLTSNPIVQAAAGNQTQKQVPLLEGTYFLKFVDSDGNKSINAASIVVTPPAPQPRSVVKTWVEQSLTPQFAGAKTEMVYDTRYAGLVLDYIGIDGGTSFPFSDFLWGGNASTKYDLLDGVSGGQASTTLTDVLDGGTATTLYGLVNGGFSGTDYTSVDTNDGGASSTTYEYTLDLSDEALYGGTSGYTGTDVLDGSDSLGKGLEAEQSGEYIFRDILDLGAVYDLNIRRRIVSQSFSADVLWDDLNDIDALGSVDGVVLDVVAGYVLVRTTNDDPTTNATWTDWNEVLNGLVRGRAFQLKLKAVSESPLALLSVSELGATAELQQRVEQSGTLTTTAGAYSVTFSNAFYAAPSISITQVSSGGANDMASGDFYTLGTPTATGFTITFKNGASSVARQFTYTATGYGRRI